MTGRSTHSKRNTRFCGKKGKLFCRTGFRRPRLWRTGKAERAEHRLPENLNLLALNFAVSQVLAWDQYCLTVRRRGPELGDSRRHANKEAQLDDLGLDRTARGQLVEASLTAKRWSSSAGMAMSTFSKSTRCRRRRDGGRVCGGVVNEKMPHGLGGGGEEMSAIFQGRVFAADQARQTSCTKQWVGGVTRRAWPFYRLRACEFGIDQRNNSSALRSPCWMDSRMRVTSLNQKSVVGASIAKQSNSTSAWFCKDLFGGNTAGRMGC